MLKHYLTLALRNLQKYSLQTIVSILGLAAGFVCLSLSALWVHYNNTYNAGIPHVDELYMMSYEAGKLITPTSFANDYTSLPEMVANTQANLQTDYVSGPFADREIITLHADSCCYRVFDIPVLEGDAHFWRRVDEGVVALTASLAKELFPGENPIGKQLILNYEEPREVAAVVADMDRHTDFWGEMIVLDKRWGDNGGWAAVYTVIRLHPGKAVYDSFARKAYEYKDREDSDPYHLVPVSLHDVHAVGVNEYYMPSSMQYSHLQAFTLVSILLVVCALVNYLTFYLNRLRGRRREMALRLVHGATPASLVALFTVEVAFVLLAAVVLGLLMVLLVQEPFALFAGIRTEGYVMRAAFLVMMGLLLVCLAVTVVAVAIVRRRSVSRTITTTPVASRRFASVSIGVQLAISLCFVFCALVMQRQLHSMRTFDWGFDYHCNALLNVTGLRSQPEGESGRHSKSDVRYAMDRAGLNDKLAAMPGITEVSDNGSSFLTQWHSYYHDDLYPSEDATEAVPVMCDSHGYADLTSSATGLSLVEGTLPEYDSWERTEVVLTETVRDKLGLTPPAVGKQVWELGNELVNEGGSTHIVQKRRSFTVVAVVRDIEFTTFNGRKIDYVFFKPSYKSNEHNGGEPLIPFSFDPKQKKDVRSRVSALMAQYPDMVWKLTFGDDRLKEMMRSENNLSLLLSSVTLVCVLIALFGIYSIITLACRQRRKEIAVRKVYGAKVGDILSLFIKEYGLILVIASAVAFVVGSLIMHHWLESYVHRTPLSWWLYVGLFAGVALVIALCVGGRVWKTANENPADVVKSE